MGGIVEDTQQEHVACGKEFPWQVGEHCGWKLGDRNHIVKASKGAEQCCSMPGSKSMSGGLTA